MRFRFELTGITSLLMHADDVEAADRLNAWRKDPRNKSISVPGDDRSPPWTWHTYIYHDGKHLIIPSDNLMIALRVGATKIPAAKGKGTFKALSQSGLSISSEYLPFSINGGRAIKLAEIHKLEPLAFADQSSKVRDLGFSLSVKRARVGDSKHVRVRPRFDDWHVAGEIDVVDPAISESVLNSMFTLAGRAGGLCDGRPSAPKSPGSAGMFTSKLVKIA
jgi:hypothetical protein